MQLEFCVILRLLLNEAAFDKHVSRCSPHTLSLSFPIISFDWRWYLTLSHRGSFNWMLVLSTIHVPSSLADEGHFVMRSSFHFIQLINLQYNSICVSNGYITATQPYTSEVVKWIREPRKRYVVMCHTIGGMQIAHENKQTCGVACHLQRMSIYSCPSTVPRSSFLVHPLRSLKAHTSISSI